MKERTMVQENENARNEMGKILWTLVEDETPKSEVASEDVNVTLKETKTPENEVEVTEEIKEMVEEPVKEQTQEPVVEKVEKVKKPKTESGKLPESGEWVNEIPEEDKLTPGDVLYCDLGNGKGKFAQFISYGKKKHIIWANMFKKDSTEFMSRAWSISLEDCQLVKINGVVQEGFSENEGVFSK